MKLCSCSAWGIDEGGRFSCRYILIKKNLPSKRLEYLTRSNTYRQYNCANELSDGIRTRVKDQAIDAGSYRDTVRM